MTAVVYGNTEMVEYLADLPGIDLKVKTNYGKFVMDLAMEQHNGKYTNIFKI